MEHSEVIAFWGGDIFGLIDFFWCIKSEKLKRVLFLFSNDDWHKY